MARADILNRSLIDRDRRKGDESAVGLNDPRGGILDVGQTGPIDLEASVPG